MSRRTEKNMATAVGPMEEFGGGGAALLPRTRQLLSAVWEQLCLLLHVIYYTFMSGRSGGDPRLCSHPTLSRSGAKFDRCRGAFTAARCRVGQFPTVSLARNSS